MRDLTSTIPDKTEMPELPTPSEKFDPSIHAVDKEGNGILLPSGKYRKKRRTAQKTKNKEGEESLYKQGAALIVNMLEGTCMTSFGEAWQMAKEEKAMNNMAWETYLSERGIEGLPGWLLVLLCTSAYALPRLATDEQTQEKAKKGAGLLSRFATWGKQKAISIFVK